MGNLRRSCFPGSEQAFGGQHPLPPPGPPPPIPPFHTGSEKRGLQNGFSMDTKENRLSQFIILIFQCCHHFRHQRHCLVRDNGIINQKQNFESILT